MKDYFRQQKARSILVIGMTVFMILLSSAFIITGLTGEFVVGLIFGIPVAGISLYSLYSIFSGGIVTISVKSNIVRYKSSSWPKRDFSFSLGEVIQAQIRNDSLRSSFTLKDGSIRKMGWVGNSQEFRDYLETEYPEIKLEYIEGS